MPFLSWDISGDARLCFTNRQLGQLLGRLATVSNASLAPISPELFTWTDQKPAWVRVTGTNLASLKESSDHGTRRKTDRSG